MDTIGTATYSPEDNKIRIDPFQRLDPETYTRLKAAGFIWAPRQKIFVAPMWTPDRADLAEELCGEIGDEDKSLVERAEERAERFEDYSESRAEDANRAREAVSAIADGIPLGQPILVGHHSEKHARKDAERIENGMRRAVKMWETSQYWQSRAAGAIRHAKYKERPDVRARRIKGLGADIRSYKARYTPADNPPNVIMQSDWNATGPDAPKVPHVWCAPRGGRGGSWVRVDALPGLEKHYSRWIRHCELRLEYECAMLAEDGGTVADKTKPEVGGACQCWASPGYGKGWSYIAKVNKVSVSIGDPAAYGGKVYVRTMPFDKLRAVMSKAQVDAARAEGRIHEAAEKHGFYLIENEPQTMEEKVKALCQDAENINVAIQEMAEENGIKLEEPTEAKRDPGPEKPFSPWDALRMATFTDDSIKLQSQLSHQMYMQVNKLLESAGGIWNRKQRAHIFRQNPADLFDLKAEIIKNEAASFDTIKEALKAGVKVAVADQLFPTPPHLARRMVDAAGVMAGRRILEPSAGTGNILRAIFQATTGPDCAKVTAIEINPTLAEELRKDRKLRVYANEDNYEIRCADFLECVDERGFDRIVMNPPFSNGQDIKHILHAFEMLGPDGRLVAICANGPRQQEKLKPFVEERGGTWEPLPAGTFEDSGTGVNTVLLVVDKATETPTEPAKNAVVDIPPPVDVDQTAKELAVLDALDDPEAAIREEAGVSAPLAEITGQALAPDFGKGIFIASPGVDNRPIGQRTRQTATSEPLPGMDGHLEAQRKAAGARQAEALTEKFNRPPADLSAKAGDIERKAPLFRDTEASGQGRLF